jgi:hypothetical protein
MQAGLSGKRLTLREIFCSGVVSLAICQIVLLFVYFCYIILCGECSASVGLTTIDGGSTQWIASAKPIFRALS